MADAPHRSFPQRWADFVTRHAVLILVLTGVTAGGCALAAAAFLKVNPSRNDLLARNLRFNQRFLDWWNSFPGAYDLTVVADTQGADGSDQSAEAKRLIDDLAASFRNEAAVVRFDYGAPASAFAPRTARLLPLDEFRDVVRDAERAVPLLQTPTLSQLLSSTVRGMANSENEQGEEVDHARDIDGLTQLITAITAAMRGEEPADALRAIAGTDESEEWHYLTSPNGRFVFMRVTPHEETDNVNASGSAIAAMRSRLAEVQAKHPTVEAGLTGVEVIETDETNAAMHDASFTSVIAVVALCALLIYSFRGIRTPILLNISLYVGVAWSFGYLLLAVGHLQILSVFFVLILLGLGMDFGVHFVTTVEATRWHDIRTKGSSPLGSAFERAFRRSFGGITLGAMCTALSFGTTAFTKFLGIAELGIIAAGGILLCLVATFTVLPALIRVFHKNVGTRGMREDVEAPDQPQRDRLAFIHNRPAITLSIAGVFLVFCAWHAARIQFDYDLMRLQPRGVNSVEWQNKLLKEGGVSAWFAVSVADSLDLARERAAQFAALPTVGQVNGIGMLFPADEEEKRAIAREAGRTIAPALAAAESPDKTPPFNAAEEAQALGSQLISLRAIFRSQLNRHDIPVDIRASMERLGAALDGAIETITSLNPTTLNARVGKLHDAYSELRRTTAERIRNLLDDQRITPADFPQEILRPYIDRTDPEHPRYSIEIHPRTPPDVTNALDPKFLPTFVNDLKSVDPNITGVLMQIYYSGKLMVRSYLYAGLLSVVLVVIVLTIALRSLYDALLCILPIVMGFGAVLAAMQFTGHTLNAANIMVLPLMFGIGVDCGVHVVHRFHQDPHDRPLGLSHGTGKGITVTTVTNILGFGAMLFASHRGIQSLGMVMALGMTLTLLASIIVLPAWLELRVRGKSR